MVKIVKSNPFICEKVWAGDRLSPIKKVGTDKKIGETWEISTHPDGNSLIGETPLSNLCSLSYIVKFIDTSDNLSIQVHPTEEYAKEFENSKGKTECWLILGAEENSGIYLGFKKGTTKKEFFTAVESNMPVDKYLNFFPVKPGDFFYLPPGTIHAIGGGVTLCEVQQNSGITYRVWDWNRVGLDGKPRDLHIEKAKDVTDFNDNFNEKLFSLADRNLLDQIGISTIADHEDFNIQLFSNLTQKSIELNLEEKSSIILLKGSVKGDDFELSEMDSGFVLESGLFELKVESGTSFLLVSGR